MLDRVALATVLCLAAGAAACTGPSSTAGVGATSTTSTSSSAGSPPTSTSTSTSASTGSVTGAGGATSSTAGAGGAAGTGGASSSTTGAGGTAGAGGVASTGGAATGGAGPCGPGGPAEILQTGQVGQLLLRGMVVTPDQAFAGEVLIAGDAITCVAPSCAGTPGASTAMVVDTHGIVLPGLVDTHNHILFDIFDETDWTPSMSYGDHNQWTNEPQYHALVDAKQYLNGESGSPVDLGCELDKYGEIKGLVAGTTSIVGAANPANRACYGSLARTIDQSPNGLPSDKIQVGTLFPSTAAADGICTNFTSGKTDAYVVHVAEGTDATALAEFGSLGTVTTTADCLDAAETAIVHGVALGDPELSLMAQQGMSLVWSPQSNVFLYGGGTDLTATANVPLALSKGINVALAPDWSIGGSQNMLDELRFADRVDNTVWGDQITPKLLVQMATTHAAHALGLGGVIGALAPGMKADVMVIGGDPCAPYDALLAATPADVRLVLVGGVSLYGDPALKGLGPSTPGCEDLTVCTSAKFICVAAPSTSPTDAFGETLADIQTTLSTALDAYDAMALTQWKFAPITPIVRCP